MRFLIEIFVIAAVISLGWSTSFHHHFESAKTLLHLNSATTSSPPQAAKPQAAPAPPLPVVNAPAADRDRAFTGHILYKDQTGKTYWLDAEGRRHYQP